MANLVNTEQYIQADVVVHNVNVITQTRDSTNDSTSDSTQGWSVLENATVAWQNGKFVYVGASQSAPKFESTKTIDGQQQWLTPGLVDCHTHLVYGGNRAGEFEQLQQGVRYEDIAKAGGGIKSTVAATRALSEDELYASAVQRLIPLINEGVTTVEIKSGYGLNIDTELKMLRVAKRIGEQLPITVSATCLAAHAVPLEYQGKADDYLTLIIEELLPKVKQENLAQAVDVFCEFIGFSAEQSKRLFAAAKALGFAIKGHVEQLSDSQGTEAVCAYQGWSADHVEYVNEAQVQQMASADVTAVILPGAFYYLKETQKPPIELFRKHKVTMAIATDLNPGSSPLGSLLTAANFGCVLFGFTPAEAFNGITQNAAKALGLANSKGKIAVGYDADCLLFQCEHPRQLIHEINLHRPTLSWHQGKERAPL
ncbi:imidazolonepropionase [Reinekea forsetii]|nr:imidazolonepropionase [Reinekea forsetii]